MLANSVSVLFYSCLIIGVFLIAALVKKEPSQSLKLFLFLGMIVPAVFTTIYLAAATVMENRASVTAGPVHWHADFQIYSCDKNLQASNQVLGRTILLAHGGEEENMGKTSESVDMVDPKGLSNRVGTSVFHEHGDNRIHIEGVVRNLRDIRLEKFFEVIGGQLTPSFLRIPTNHGEEILQNGMNCPNGQPGTLQTFVYKTKGNRITQEKLADFPNYVISPYSNIPPGDCLILEFSSEIKNKTDKICPFYEIAIQKGEYKYEN